LRRWSKRTGAGAGCAFAGPFARTRLRWRL
jgi:hypothetical protein